MRSSLPPPSFQWYYCGALSIRVEYDCEVMKSHCQDPASSEQCERIGHDIDDRDRSKGCCELRDDTSPSRLETLHKRPRQGLWCRARLQNSSSNSRLRSLHKRRSLWRRSTLRAVLQSGGFAQYQLGHRPAPHRHVSHVNKARAPAPPAHSAEIHVRSKSRARRGFFSDRRRRHRANASAIRAVVSHLAPRAFRRAARCLVLFHAGEYGAAANPVG